MIKIFIDQGLGRRQCTEQKAGQRGRVYTYNVGVYLRGLLVQDVGLKSGSQKYAGGIGNQ